MKTGISRERTELIEQIEELKEQRKKIDEHIKNGERQLVDLAAREAKERGSDVGMFF